MLTLLDTLKGHFDYIIIDAPPVLAVTDAAIISKITSGAVVISAAGKTKKAELSSALDSLETVGGKVLGIVPTQVPAKGPDAYGYGPYSYREYRTVPQEAPAVAAHTSNRSSKDQRILGSR